MTLSEPDRELVAAELGREPTRTEEALFENLWSEHCAYRSSRPLLSAFESEGEQVVVGPGDDAAVVRVPSPDGDDAAGDSGCTGDVYVTLGIESHNHPSYVDPYDGAATGVGGIVRDTLSMGAYPIALADSLYFGEFDDEHSRYLLEGVVEGISDYGNSIGVPTVAGSTDFHPGYEGNPLVNVACVGLVTADRLVTADATEPGNALVLVGNATGRDGLGGASFASEDLSEDAETEDRPAVQVGDPYTEKLLVEANEVLVDRGLVEAARDLGAAGLGGASSEMVAKGGLGADIALDRVHQREPGMNALEILLAESQERMCYEVAPENVTDVRQVAERFDLGCSVIGEVTDTGRFVCTFEGSEAHSASDTSSRDEAPRGRTTVDVPAEYLADGAPMNDLPAEEPPEPDRDLPDVPLDDAFEAVVGSPNTASKRWIYRQYDHEVGLRTSVHPGDDAAVMALRETGEERRSSERSSGESRETSEERRSSKRASGESRETGTGLALSSGANPRWTSVAPYEGARAVALENATNLAAKGATPLAAVDCLNGGNPEKPNVYGGFTGIVDGLADMARELSVPIVGGNVSLYNDSAAGPIPPTPTLAMVGTKTGYDAPPAAFDGGGTVLVVGDRVLAGEGPLLGGSVYLDENGGSDRFPAVPANAPAFIEALAAVANRESTLACHDVSHGGLAVALAEMVTAETGAEVMLDNADGAGSLFHEQAGRAVVETTDPAGVREAFDGVAPVAEIGTATDDGVLDLTVDGETLRYAADEIAERRDVLARELD